MRKANCLVDGIAVAVVTIASPAMAQDVRRYDIAEGDLSTTLKRFAEISGREIIASSSILAGGRSDAIIGNFTPERALALLLARSGLTVDLVDGAFVIRPISDGDAATATGAATIDAIVVTGSRIRGAPVASPVIRIDREAARDTGQATLGEIARSIPQSFGGGQNPGIGFNVPAINGVDTGGGSSINLRGLGSDATLTLLNGHRVAYSGSRQSIDVSTIPLGILERIEIVPDGSSALYGSDAVGGVANIILRRGMDGAEARARIGASTEGGNFQQQYGLTGGARWTSGGFVAAYEFNRTTAIDFDDRSYAVSRSPGLRLLPSARNHNAVISAHQSLTESIEFKVDGLFNDRRNVFVYSQNPAGNLALSRVEQRTSSQALAVAPSLTATLGNFQLALSGTLASDRVDYRIVSQTPTLTSLLGAGCFCNRAQSIELAGDGRLFRVPGGWAKIAAGVGYRNTFLRNDRGAGSPLNFERAQSNRYAYGEISIPAIGSANDIIGVHRLNLSGAVRYERISEIGGVVTPKLGIIYSPVPALDVRATWGRSFRAPTLLQRYQPPALTLLRATTLGGVGFPATATALYIQGGSANLRPERAQSVSVSAAFRPASITGLELELGYFSTRYVDRIVTPIGFITQALRNPIYAAQIVRSPSPAVLAAVLASGASFTNGTGVAYDPVNVVAFVDNSNVNAGRQRVHGVDAIASYRAELGAKDSVSVSANASYLVSDRQISADQPTLSLAGILFNPPHWRARSVATWRHSELALTTSVNYLGPLDDTRTTPALRIPGQATIDLALRYRSPDRAPAILRGLDITFAMQNLLDAPPPPIATGPVTDTPYDSTNYSAIGRFVSLTVAKRW